MALRKRGNSYQIDYFDPSGKRIRKSFRKRKDAEAELGKRVSLMVEGRYLDIKKDCIITLGELIGTYTENYQDQRSFSGTKVFFLKTIEKYFGTDTLLDKIKYVGLETYRNKLKTKLTKHGKLREASSINSEMSALHQLFRKAVEWEMIERNPFDKGKPLWLKLNNKRKRFLSEDEIGRLLESSRGCARDIIEMATNTGMRRKEILTLKWNQIRDGFIYLSRTKTDEAREIPVNDDLAELIKNLKNRKTQNIEYIFCSRNGNPYHNINNSFRIALRKARITDFKFHDLRHTFASHFIMRGGSLRELQVLLGHKDPKMTMRYAHLSTEHQQKTINRMTGLTRKCHKTVTQGRQVIDFKE